VVQRITKKKAGRVGSNRGRCSADACHIGGRHWPCSARIWDARMQICFTETEGNGSRAILTRVDGLGGAQMSRAKVVGMSSGGGG
jgi:hypothetical protein